MAGKRACSKTRGYALVLTLWVLAALLLVVGVFASIVHTSTAVASNFGDIAQCRWAARAGIDRAIIEVERQAKLPLIDLEGESLTLTSEEEEVELGGSSYEVVIEDEAGKVNINTAPAETLEALFGSREIADAIIDWRDADDTPETQGAENDHYSSLEEPYRCKNAPFDTLGELRLVKGITPELLAEPVTDGGPKLEDLLTVKSSDTNTRMDGTARVNIQTATSDQLQSALSDALEEREITAIISYRDGTPAAAGQQARPGTSFRTAGDIIRVPDLGREKVQEIFDRLTVSDAQQRAGVVNLNTAPVEVLATVAGFDEGTAQAVVQYRDDNGAFTDVGQLLAVDEVSDEVFAKAADQFTVRSRRFKITATGRMENGASRTIIAIVDVTTGSAEIKYWRE